jgi:hypothetical protein
MPVGAPTASIIRTPNIEGSTTRQFVCHTRHLRVMEASPMPHPIRSNSGWRRLLLGRAELPMIGVNEAGSSLAALPQGSLNWPSLATGALYRAFSP